MGSCGKSTILDDASGGSVIGHHLCSEFPLQSIPVQRSCSVVTCNALDSNVDHSNMMEGCMNLSRQVPTGSANLIDLPETSRDSLLMVRKNEITDTLLLDNDSQTCSSMCCEQIEVSNLESVSLCSEEKPCDEGGHEMPSDFILTSGLSKDCVQQGGQKDEKSNVSPYTGASLAHMEDKNDAGLPTDLQVDCHQQSEQDIMRNADPLVEVANKCDLCGIEADDCKQTLSQGSEVPEDAIYTEVGGVSDQLRDQKDGKDGESPCEDFVDKESIIDMHVQVLSSPGSQTTLGSLPVANSPGKATQLEKGIDKTDIDFNAEDVTKVTEQNIDVLNEIIVETKNNILRVDGNACKLNDNSSEANANFTLRKIFSPESGLPSVYINSMPDPPPKGAVSCGSIAGNSGQADSIRKDIIEVDCIHESKCSDIASLPFRRNSRRSKSGHKTQTKRASRKGKNKASVPLLGGGMKIILEATRKKRSCFSKPARSSIWGLVGNINKFFEQDNGLGADEVMRQGLGKVRGNRKSGKANKDDAISGSESSMKKCCGSTTRVRLKIKLGKDVDLSFSNVLVPEVLNSSGSASSLGPGSGSKEVASNAVDKFSEEIAVGKVESFKNYLDKDDLVLNGQIENDHLESTTTMEKSDGFVEELCPMIPLERMVEPLRDAVNNKGMDPGTSPDSEVINSIPEGQAGESNQEGVHDAILGSSREFNSLVEVDGCKRGKKKENLTSSSSCIVEGGSQGPPRKSKAKHSKNRGRKKNFNDVVCSMDPLTSTDINAASNLLSCIELSAEPLPLSGEIELEDSSEVLKVKSSMKDMTICRPDVDHELSESQDIDNLMSSARSGRKLPKSLKSSKVSKIKSKASDSTSRKKTGSRHKEKPQRPIKKSEVKGRGVSENVISEVEDRPHPGSFLRDH